MPVAGGVELRETGLRCSPKSALVISGKKAAVASVLAQLSREGVKSKELNTSNAFHSPVMDPILGQFADVASTVH